MGMSGWIKTYRSLADHWLAEHPEKLGWWVLLLLKVNHEDKRVLIGNYLIEVKRGQIVASFSYLSTLWHTSKRTAERFVEILEKDGMVSRCVSRKVTILTICNYESYQESKANACTDTCADDEPIVSQSVAEIKKEKESKEIYNNNSNACTREDEFVRQYRTEGLWMDVALILHLKSLEDCKSLFDEFVVEYQHKGESHKDYSDFKRHFIQWARIAIQKRPTQITAEKPQKKVSSNEDLFKEMYGR
jgi:DNA replication protein DnaD